MHSGSFLLKLEPGKILHVLNQNIEYLSNQNIQNISFKLVKNGKIFNTLDNSFFLNLGFLKLFAKYF